MRHTRAIFAEALATARSQPVASVVSIVMVAGMVLAVLLTTGRTVGSEQSVLSSIDTAGTRSIVVRADADAGLDTSVLDRISGIDGIQWAAAFGNVDDVTNVAVPGGTKVPARIAWGSQFTDLGIPASPSLPGHSAWASARALTALGIRDAAGGVTDGSGEEFAIDGRLDVPDYLGFLEPLEVIPRAEPVAAPETVSILVVIADRPDLVAPLSGVLVTLLGVSDPTKVQVTTSEDLATLRSLVQGQLGAFGRNLVIVIFGLTAVLVAAILYGLVMLRRKDFGRRRALGASQGLIVALLLTQMALLSAVGALAGTAGALAALALSNDPLPGPWFVVAIDVLAVAVGLVAALLPALAAARRDPLSELRVP